jgi:hypothetical protein
MEGMNQFGIQYIYTWKFHNETLRIDYLKQKYLFFQNGGQGEKHVLFGGLLPEEGGKI